MKEASEVAFDIPAYLNSMIVQPFSTAQPPRVRLHEHGRLFVSIARMDKYK